MATRMFARLEKGELVLGCLTVTGSPNLIEIMAFAGMDYVIIDQMFTEIDWGTAAHLIRAAKGAGITPLIRTEANPWVGGAGSNVPVVAARALSLGAEGIMTSVSTRAQVEQLIEIGRDWHRGIHVIPFTPQSFPDYQRRVAEGTLVLPTLESLEAFRNMEEILATPGLRGAFLALGDACRLLGHPFEYEHPEVWALLDRAIRVARERGLVIGTNNGYAFATLDAMIQRAKRLHDRGVQMVMLQTPEFLLQIACGTVVEGVRKLVG